MIKNYHMIREAEVEYQSNQKLSLDKRMELFEEMYLFTRNFERMEKTPPEETPHVKALIKLAAIFKKIGKIKNA